MVGMARQTATTEIPVEPLSDTAELLRAHLAIGIIGCLDSPIVCSILILGHDWWIRVAASFPSQPLLESTTALFGTFASTQASKISHRAGKAGVALFSDLVPAFEWCVYGLPCFRVLRHCIGSVKRFPLLNRTDFEGSYRAWNVRGNQPANSRQKEALNVEGFCYHSVSNNALQL
jgi:hypothetical protein